MPEHRAPAGRRVHRRLRLFDEHPEHRVLRPLHSRARHREVGRGAQRLVRRPTGWASAVPVARLPAHRHGAEVRGEPLHARREASLREGGVNPAAFSSYVREKTQPASYVTRSRGRARPWTRSSSAARPCVRRAWARPHLPAGRSARERAVIGAVSLAAYDVSLQRERRAPSLPICEGASGNRSSQSVSDPFSAPAKRSPTASRRWRRVFTVNAFGSSCGVTSSHLSGVDTGAPSTARTA